jgi:hypothetical protein
MAHKKLLNLKTKQKEKLDAIQREIIKKGGEVSIMALISDSIDVFIDHHSDVAIKHYSGLYID